MDDKVKSSIDPARQPYAGYHLRHDRASAQLDVELAACGPGTPLGEHMRRYWQPVCLSQELNDVPKAIRIMNEDLVAFRDRSGRVGVVTEPALIAPSRAPAAFAPAAMARTRTRP